MTSLVAKHMPEENAAIDKIAKAIKPLVDKIEASIPTCKDHYDEYMVAISMIAGMCGNAQHKGTQLAVGLALTRAGANRQGVISALQAMGAMETAQRI